MTRLVGFRASHHRQPPTASPAGGRPGHPVTNVAEPPDVPGPGQLGDEFPDPLTIDWRRRHRGRRPRPSRPPGARLSAPPDPGPRRTPAPGPSVRGEPRARGRPRPGPTP